MIAMDEKEADKDTENMTAAELREYYDRKAKNKLARMSEND